MMKRQLKLLLWQLSVLAAVLAASVAMLLVLVHTPDIRRAPEKPASAMGEGEWQNRFQQIVDLFNEGKLAEADDLIGTLLAERPGSEKVWQLKGSIAYRRGLYEEAERAFRQVLRIQPYNAAGLNNLSQTLWRLDQKEPALAAVLRAADLTPENGAILLNAAAICAQTEHPEEAIMYLKRAIRAGVPLEAIARNKALVAFLEKPEVIKALQENEKTEAETAAESTPEPPVTPKVE